MNMLRSTNNPFTREFAFGRVAAALVLALCLQFAAGGHALASAPMSEQDKIDALLNDIEHHSELKFMRLGSVHSSSEAASMLRTKLRFAGGRVKTANDFIQYIATATVSGHPYYVIYPDGKQVPSATFLRGELKRITDGSQGALAKK